MFQALRQGSQFYILEKGERLSLKVGQVECVSAPKPRYSTSYPMNYNDTVVDIKVKVGDDRMDFNQVPSSSSIADFGTSNVVISESKEAMLSEVESLMQSSKRVLDSLDHHKQIVCDSEEIILSLNPEIAKEKERDDAISQLRGDFSDLKSEVGKILKLLKSAKDE